MKNNYINTSEVITVIITYLYIYTYLETDIFKTFKVEKHVLNIRNLKKKIVSLKLYNGISVHNIETHISL